MIKQIYGLFIRRLSSNHGCINHQLVNLCGPVAQSLNCFGLSSLYSSPALQIPNSHCTSLLGSSSQGPPWCFSFWKEYTSNCTDVRLGCELAQRNGMRHTPHLSRNFKTLHLVLPLLPLPLHQQPYMTVKGCLL